MIQPKGITFEQIGYKRCQGIAVTSLHCILFSTSKNKDLKQILKSATDVALNFSGPQNLFFPSNVLKLTI